MLSIRPLTSLPESLGEMIATEISTPIGPISLLLAENELLAVYWCPLLELSLQPSVTMLPPAKAVAPAKIPIARQLQEYFRRKRHDFDATVLLLGTPFEQKVLTRMAQIPYGQVMTYGELAAAVGAPKAARAVGLVCRHNPVSLIIPCHRVVGAGNRLVGYGGPTGTAMKEFLLKLEGVTTEFH